MIHITQQDWKHVTEAIAIIEPNNMLGTNLFHSIYKTTKNVYLISESKEKHWRWVDIPTENILIFDKNSYESLIIIMKKKLEQYFL